MHNLYTELLYDLRFIICKFITCKIYYMHYVRIKIASSQIFVLVCEGSEEKGTFLCACVCSA